MLFVLGALSIDLHLSFGCQRQIFVFTKLVRLKNATFLISKLLLDVRKTKTYPFYDGLNEERKSVKFKINIYFLVFDHIKIKTEKKKNNV